MDVLAFRYSSLAFTLPPCGIRIFCLSRLRTQAEIKFSAVFSYYFAALLKQRFFTPNGKLPQVPVYFVTACILYIHSTFRKCGPNYTRKMETMFQDIELSRQLSKNFRASCPVVHAIELSVIVICPASWPPYQQTTATYPPEVSSVTMCS
ncbi:hypothetical protein AHF37_06709 [Paragonimus kellicotti]|nr:hypothetical protein AHF37_06709 [Paragonimus kellicotti]